MTEETSAPAPTDETQADLPESGSRVLRGTPVSPGLGIGRALRQAYDLSKIGVRRVPRDQVENELNRFHRALSESRRQLDDLKQRLRGAVPEKDVRILDTHVAYLKDSVFLTDVENLVLGEQLALEAAIAKVILDFDRIFRLVENEVLRERAVDLRDVGIRVLRNMERHEEEERAKREGVDSEDSSGSPSPEDPVNSARPEESADSMSEYVLVARELSIVDMFNLDNRRVIAILAEAGSLTSHAAILARSMRIPTLTGVDGLLDAVADGDYVIVDATEGSVRVRPEAIVREQFKASLPSADELESLGDGPVDLPEARTADGEQVVVSASCGNLPEVESARSLGFAEIGLYRTELLYVVDREPPSVEALVAHYRAVLEQAGDAPVTYRLLDVDSSTHVPYLHSTREPNPQLGRVGVRALLAHEQLLRNQLQAFLRASAERGRDVRVAVPKVIDCSELRRVKEVFFEERFVLKKSGLELSGAHDVGVVIETPAAVLGIGDLAREADFLSIGLDSLQQYLLATDRDNGDLSASFERLHPVVLRAVGDVVTACEQAGRALSVFGVTAAVRANQPLLLGVGVRHFVVAPVGARRFLEDLRRVDSGDARRAARLARQVSCPSELAPILDGYGHELGKKS